MVITDIEQHSMGFGVRSKLTVKHEVFCGSPSSGFSSGGEACSAGHGIHTPPDMPPVAPSARIREYLQPSYYLLVLLAGQKSASSIPNEHPALVVPVCMHEVDDVMFLASFKDKVSKSSINSTESTTVRDVVACSDASS